MSHYLIQQIEGQRNIQRAHLHAGAAVHGGDHLESICLEDVQTGDAETVHCGRMFVFIGAEPRTDWLDGVVVRDDHGFIVAGPDLLGRAPSAGWTLDRPLPPGTSVPGVFVAGDVRAESAKRVASAVGEGSMAVTLVHRYLERAMTIERVSPRMRRDEDWPAPRRTAHAVPVRGAVRRAARIVVRATATSRAYEPGRSAPRASRRPASTC